MSQPTGDVDVKEMIEKLLASEEYSDKRASKMDQDTFLKYGRFHKCVLFLMPFWCSVCLYALP